MNLLLLEEHELREGKNAVLRDRRAEHVRQVLGARKGQELRVGVIGRGVGEAVVVETDDDCLVLGEIKVRAPATAPEVSLILALPRPKALRRTLQTAACFGVRRIDLVNAWKVQRSYWQSPNLEEDSIREDLLLGCEQGGHPWLPELQQHRFLMDFLGEKRADEQCARFIAHPRGQEWLPSELPSHKPIEIAIGPEGGWTDEELQTFAGLGFVSTKISDSVLRTEIAIAATFAQLDWLRAKG